MTRQTNAIDILLHAGADPSLADRHGNTPAHLSVVNQSGPCLQSLVKYLRPGVSANKPFPELNYLNYEGEPAGAGSRLVWFVSRFISTELFKNTKDYIFVLISDKWEQSLGHQKGNILEKQQGKVNLLK